MWSENNCTFKSTVSGEDRESLWLMVIPVISCLLLLLFILCVYMRVVCVSMRCLHVFIWMHVVVLFRITCTAGLCVFACFTSLFVFMWWCVLCRACVSVCAHVAACVLVCVHHRSPSVKTQSPLYSFQHLQHHVYHDEMSIFLHTDIDRDTDETAYYQHCWEYLRTLTVNYPESDEQMDNIFIFSERSKDEVTDLFSVKMFICCVKGEPRRSLNLCLTHWTHHMQVHHLRFDIFASIMY